MLPVMLPSAKQCCFTIFRNINVNAKQTFPAMKSIPVSLSYSGIKVLDKYTNTQ